MTPVVLIAGAAGQLGLELQRCVPAGTHIVAVDVDTLDLTNVSAVDTFVDSCRPAVIINAAAFTAVVAAETNVALAQAVNVGAVSTLATAARRVDARLVHISTDFVFGESVGRPLRPDDHPAPVSVYGQTKRAGEVEAITILGPRALVVRTAWLYSTHGTNFVKTMLRVMRERDEVAVVVDQIGTPTWARTLATVIWAAAARDDLHGVLHWSDAGVASWYDFAVAIQEEALALGLLKRAVPVRAIATSDYPTAARRPQYSVLDKSATVLAIGQHPAHWRVNLRQMLQEFAHA